MTDRSARIGLLSAVILFASPGSAFASGEVDYSDVELAIAAVGKAVADEAYGEYLAGECASCHAADAPNQAQIPVLAGQRKDALIRAMIEYRTGYRTNKVMQTIMTTKGDEEIASLAAWYAGKEQ